MRQDWVRVSCKFKIIFNYKSKILVHTSTAKGIMNLQMQEMHNVHKALDHL